MIKKEIYNVFICDDDQRQIDRINKDLGRAEIILSDDIAIELNSMTKTNFNDARNYLEQNKWSGGIYFLDVELGEDTKHNTGFDLAELIKKQDERAQIIFVTSYEDLSIITFQRRLGPIDYIVKTDDLDKFRKRIINTLEVAIDHLQKFDYIKKMNFAYHVGRHVRNINIDEIIYIITTQIPHKLLMIEKNGEAQFLGSINEYAKNNPMLEKISQSCLINPNNIKAIDLKKRLVTFINGDTQEYSFTNAKKMHTLLKRYNYKIENLVKNKNKHEL